MADAPAIGSYLTRVPEAGLSGEFALNSLPLNSIIKTTTDGYPAAAIAGSDYLLPNLRLTSLTSISIAANDLILGLSSNAFTTLSKGTVGTFLSSTLSGYEWASVPPLAATYLTVGSENTLTNSRQLIAGQGLIANASGKTLVMSVSGDVLSLVNIDPGIVCSIDSNNFAPRQITSNTGTLAVTNPSGVGGNISVDAVSDTTIQRVTVTSGINTSTRSTLRFIPSVNTGISVVDNEAQNRTDITISASIGDSNASVITIDDSRELGFPNSFPLTDLNANGMLYWNHDNTLVSLAIPGVDFTAASAATNSIVAMDVVAGIIPIGTSGGTFNALPIGPDGSALKVVGGNVVWGNDETVQADYITKTDYTAELPTSFPLSGMSSGIIKVTTITGDLTTAVADIDYVAPTANVLALGTASSASGTLYVGNGTALEAFALGGVNSFLTSDGAVMSWTTGSKVISLASASSATGTLYVGDGTSLTALAIGPANYVLKSNGTTAIWDVAPSSATPTLAQVLTAGNSAGSQSISGIGSSLLFTPGNYTIGATSASAGTELTLRQGDANFKLRIGTGGLDVTRAMVTGARLYVNTSIECPLITSLDTASAISMVGTQMNFGNSVGSSIFTMQFDSGSPTVNSEFLTPILTITNVSATATDSSTAVQMSKFKIVGGYASSRNWMVVPVFSGAASIARMRIALDKGYFATEQHPVRVPLEYDESYYGLIVKSDNQYMNAPTLTEAHIKVSVCEKEMDKNVYGILSYYDFVMQNDEEDGNPIYNIRIPQKTDVDKIAYVSAGGEGQIWVCNINGSIEAGDYITSSGIPGIGMRQEDNLKRNYTIFKSAFNCDFISNSSYNYPLYDLIDDNYKIPDGDGYKYSYYQDSTFTFATIVVLTNHYELVNSEDEIILSYNYDFQRYRPDLIGQTFVATLIGGVYAN